MDHDRLLGFSFILFKEGDIDRRVQYKIANMVHIDVTIKAKFCYYKVLLSAQLNISKKPKPKQQAYF
jgi:hypothetical protein